MEAIKVDCHYYTPSQNPESSVYIMATDHNNSVVCPYLRKDFGCMQQKNRITKDMVDKKGCPPLYERCYFVLKGQKPPE